MWVYLFTNTMEKVALHTIKICTATPYISVGGMFPEAVHAAAGE